MIGKEKDNLGTICCLIALTFYKLGNFLIFHYVLMWDFPSQKYSRRVIYPLAVSVLPLGFKKKSTLLRIGQTPKINIKQLSFCNHLHMGILRKDCNLTSQVWQSLAKTLHLEKKKILIPVHVINITPLDIKRNSWVQSSLPGSFHVGNTVVPPSM